MKDLQHSREKTGGKDSPMEVKNGAGQGKASERENEEEGGDLLQNSESISLSETVLQSLLRFLKIRQQLQLLFFSAESKEETETERDKGRQRERGTRRRKKKLRVERQG
jgi:hypothetical protein